MLMHVILNDMVKYTNGNTVEVILRIEITL